VYDNITASVTPRSTVTVRQDERVVLVCLDGNLTIHVTVTGNDRDAGGYAAAAMMRDAWAQVAEGYAARIRAASPNPHDAGCRDHGHDGECFPGEAVPTCDICGEQDGPGEPDWNGETGNHRSCEDREHAEGTGRIDGLGMGVIALSMGLYL
jgi:hypothetical protein